MSISQWSTTAANNASNVTNINWAEGQAPSTVNNSARQQMADVANWYRNSAEWIDRNDSATFSSGSQIKFAGTDLTGIYKANRRIYATASTPGTLYGRITSSSTSGSDTLVNVSWDSTAVLVNEAISAVAVGLASGSSNLAMSISAIEGLTINSSQRGAILQQGEKNRFTAVTPSTNVGKVLQSNGSTSSVTYSNVRSEVIAITSSSGAATIDLSLSDVFSHTLTENTTYTFSNAGSTNVNTGFKLFLTNASTAKSATFPASVKWTDGSAPSFTTANAENVLVFETINGTVWYGALAIEDAS